MKRRHVLAALLALAGAPPALAQVPTITIEKPWARASTGRTGAVYLAMRNAGTNGDLLVGAASPVAGEVQLHTEINENGVMKMRPLKEIAVNAGTTVALKPGGMHVMLIGLKQPLKEGESIALTLTFEKAGPIEVTVPIRKAGAMEHMHM